MIQVSETYNPYTTVRDVDVIVTLEAISETAAGNATYSVNDYEPISKLSQLNTGEKPSGKYATCEKNLVMLDGTWDYLPDTLTNEKIGWWSALSSGADGKFVLNPTLTATLSQDDSCVGFTIFTDTTNIIDEFKIKTYNGDTEIYTELFDGGSSTLIADLPVTNFDKIVFEVTKTREPHRRVKVLGFRFGIIKKWDRDSITNASITEEADICGETLPINELEFEVDNSNGEFDLLGDTKKFVYKEAMKNATLSADNVGVLTNLDNLVNSKTNIFKYATCEDNLVMLDGTWDYLPDTSLNDYEIGVISQELSGEGGVFESPPSVTYSLDEDISISGLRFYFGDDNYATSITVSAYANDILVDSETFTNNEPIAEFDFAVSAINKIVFDFDSVCKQNRYLKISELQILKYADSWISYLTKDKKIKAEMVVNGETISVGEAYRFDSLEQTNGGLTAKITAKDYVDKLDNQTYTNGMHGTTTLNTALTSVLSGSGVDVEYYPSSLKNTIVSKAAPKDTTKRAATHYFAQASCATCFLNRQGNLEVKSFDVTPYVDTLTMNDMYDSNITRMGEYVNMIRLTVRDEYTDPETENTYFGGSGLYYREIENDCVNSSSGVDVANWILEQKSRRIYFEIESRGNPALELGDTIKIVARDGTAYLVVVYYQNFVFDRGLKCDIKAVVGA